MAISEAIDDLMCVRVTHYVITMLDSSLALWALNEQMDKM